MQNDRNTIGMIHQKAACTTGEPSRVSVEDVHANIEKLWTEGGEYETTDEDKYWVKV